MSVHSLSGQKKIVLNGTKDYTILHDMLFCLLLFLKLLSLKTLKGVNKKCTIIFNVEKIGFNILKSNLYFKFLKNSLECHDKYSFALKDPIC